jgi:hypothetical protein
MKKLTLTYEQGLEIQCQHLEEWKHVLTPEFYAVVEKEVERANEIVKEEYASLPDYKNIVGFEVIRGCSLASLIQNLNK